MGNRLHSRIGRKFALLAVVSLLLVLFQAHFPTVHATVRKVPDVYATIQLAVNAADPGDTIEVSADVYYENVYVEKSLTFIGQDKYTTIVDGGGTGHVFWLMTSGVAISGFTLRNGNYCGVKADMSGDHFITDNILVNNDYGIYLYQTPSNSTVVGNTLHGNSMFGIKLGGSSNNNVSNNYISDSTYGVKVDDTSEYNSIEGNTISETSYGIDVSYSSNNDVDQNNVSGKIIGIYSRYSDDVNIRNNTILECGRGIRLYQTSNNLVLGNTMVQNGQGIQLVYGSSNTVDSNLASNNDWGITTFDADGNNIIQNTASYNDYCGIDLTTSSTGNTIALNNIIQNAMQMHQDSTSGGNFWYKTITGDKHGNYWSDYEGEDTTEPPDGIGDTLTPHLGVDFDPLMQPWSTVHDVAILSVAPSKDTVYQGQVVNITVVVRNEGTVNETFNVTAKYFNRIIETKTVTNLTRYASTTLVFNWNTEGVPIDFNYEIRAEANPVAGETDIADNTFVDGTITVEEPRVLGDVNGDGLVDISDLFDLSKAYGSEPGDSNWNPDCDLNEDNKVDASDLSDLNENFGKTA